MKQIDFKTVEVTHAFLFGEYSFIVNANYISILDETYEILYEGFITDSNNLYTITKGDVEITNDETRFFLNFKDYVIAFTPSFYEPMTVEILQY
jgi:hypothetical protein